MGRAGGRALLRGRAGGRMRPMGRAPGFTLLEAIVAMVVFSVGAVALYGWLATNLRTLERVDASRERSAVTQAALDVVRRTNPMAQETGGRDLGDLRVEWRARPVEAPRSAVTQIGLPAPFQVGLYELDVRVLRDSEEVQTFRVRQVGYRYTGAVSEDDE